MNLPLRIGTIGFDDGDNIVLTQGAGIEELEQLAVLNQA